MGELELWRKILYSKKDCVFASVWPENVFCRLRENSEWTGKWDENRNKLYRFFECEGICRKFRKRH